jgi:predicted TIM-barrel fold metal-dependent hydrolase
MIDTHQHLIHREQLRYAWTEEIDVLASGTFSTLEYSRDLSGRNMAGTIFMECAVDDADYQSEARIVADHMKRPGSGLIGQIASCRPEIDAGFSDWLDEGPSLGVVGYRRVLHVVPDSISQNPVLRRNLKVLGQRGLPFDMCFFPRQLGSVALDLIRDSDDQVLVLDHCGCPDIGARAFGDWAQDIREISRHEHVFCKLSGLTAYCSPGPHDAETLRPWVDHVLECFGPARMLWGSDWPVVDLGAGLGGWIDITRELLAPLSEEERWHIEEGTARHVYRLPGAISPSAESGAEPRPA